MERITAMPHPTQKEEKCCLRCVDAITPSGPGVCANPSCECHQHTEEWQPRMRSILDNYVPNEGMRNLVMREVADLLSKARAEEREKARVIVEEAASRRTEVSFNMEANSFLKMSGFSGKGYHMGVRHLKETILSLLTSDKNDER